MKLNYANAVHTEDELTIIIGQEEGKRLVVEPDGQRAIEQIEICDYYDDGEVTHEEWTWMPTGKTVVGEALQEILKEIERYENETPLQNQMC